MGLQPGYYTIYLVHHVQISSGVQSY